MNVAVASMFRDSMPYLARYQEQVEGLRSLLEARGDYLRLIAVENDSRDGTWEDLDLWGHSSFCDLTLIKAHDGCPYYPSIDHQPRWQHIAWVCNHALEQVDDRDDVLLYVESDLVWVPDDLLALIDRLSEVEAVSCPNYHQEPGGRYYDTWGSRKDGVRFISQRPYHQALVDWAGGLIEMDSVASVLAVKADIARKTRFSPEDGFVGWCRDIRAQGHQIWLDPTLYVVHP
jgi:glycosyltransferase involved in cell wall biosynthesis